MSTYSRKSQFKDLYIRKIAGSAVYADLALACGGVWNRTELETKIDGKDYGEYTGRYRKMCTGRLPYSSTCNRIQEVLNKREIYTCNIRTWRDFPLWRLLIHPHPGVEHIKIALLSIKGEARNYVWKNLPPAQNYYEYIFSRQPHSHEQIEAVAEYSNLEALLILTALAREARNFENDSIYYYCAKHIREIFPNVICNTPQLFIRWPVLLQFYIEPIWFLQTGDHYKRLRINEVEDEIFDEENNARMTGVQLPPKHEFRQINKQELCFLKNYSLH